MSDDAKTETKTPVVTAAAMAEAESLVQASTTYRAKPKAQPNDLDMDAALTTYVEILKLLAPLKKKQENLKQVLRTLLKDEGGKYTSPEGIRAQLVSKQAAKLNKKLAKELCGARWAEVETFETEVSLRVDAPGVKGD
jgi:hypothetical protein